jgi:hypothetical protein
VVTKMSTNHIKTKKCFLDSIFEDFVREYKYFQH